MLKKILITVALAVLFWSLGADAFALTLDDAGVPKPDNLPDFESVTGIESVEATDENNPETIATQTLILFVGNIVSKVLLFASSVAIAFLIYAGANYIFAFGKDERIERGKRGMVWSLVGLLTILLSYAIIRGIITIISQVDSDAVSLYTPLTFS
jgi:hypothetical protein